MINRLGRLLKQVYEMGGSSFTGLGLILCDAPETLPIVPIRLGVDLPDDHELARCLTEISRVDHEFHDGFHVVTSDFRLLRVAQYFLPPIGERIVIDRSKRSGGRYLAALFGSALPTVRLTGIASSGFGIAVFEGGREAYFRGLDA